MSNDENSDLPSKRPYLMRAIWEWCMDAGLTPQILVRAAAAGQGVPAEFVQDGVVVLNVHDRAVRGLDMGNERVTFSARFAGVARSIDVPVDAVIAIYARENGQGLFFEAPGAGETEVRSGQGDGEAKGDGEQSGDGDSGQPRRKPDLRLV